MLSKINLPPKLQTLWIQPDRLMLLGHGASRETFEQIKDLISFIPDIRRERTGLRITEISFIKDPYQLNDMSVRIPLIKRGTKSQRFKTTSKITLLVSGTGGV